MCSTAVPQDNYGMKQPIALYIFSTMRRKRKQELYEGRKIMELALQFENLNCEELCAIDGGKRNYSIEKYVKNYLDFIKKAIDIFRPMPI